MRLLALAPPAITSTLVTPSPTVRPSSPHNSIVLPANRTVPEVTRSPPGFTTLAQRLENARNSPDVSTSAADGELVSMEELFNIFLKR